MSFRGSDRGSRGRGGGGGVGRGRDDAGGRGGGPRGGGPPRGGGVGRGRGGPPPVFNAGQLALPDARLQSYKSLVERLSRLPSSPRHPLRPDLGTLGQPITLRANFFPLHLPKDGSRAVYDYSIAIEPKTEIKRLKARILELLEVAPAFAPYARLVAHDRGERLVAASRLPQPLAIQVPFYDEGQQGPGPNARTYNVELTFVRELNMSNLIKYTDGQPEFRDYDTLPLISALNLVLQKHASNTAYRVGRNRYFFPRSPNEEKRSLSVGVEALRGFFISVRSAYKQLMVNVNVCMSAFYEPGSMVLAIQAFQRQSRGGIPKRFVQGLRVKTLHLGRTKPVKAIATTSARTTFFDCEEFGGKISVEEYYKRKYPHIRLQHAHDLPVVDISPKTKRQPTYIPAELCEILPGTPYSGKLSAQETASMIRYACKSPVENANTIVHQGLPQLGLNPEHSILQTFGLEVSRDMATVPARILPPPSVNYKSGQTPRIQNAAWNILDVAFHRGGDMRDWCVLVVQDGQQRFQGPKDPQLLGLVTGFADKCRRVGMTVPIAPPKILATSVLLPVERDPGRQQAIDAIRQTLVSNLDPQRKPAFVLVLLSKIDNYIYPGLKRLGDVRLGIHTVCMQLDKALSERGQDQYFSNVALKVNTKLGGANHLLHANDTKWLREKSTMIIGADVTHPGPGSIWGTPSIAAVVASCDTDFVQFPASMRLQESRKEMITELDEMVIERLLLYQKRNKTLPSRVLYYRDGVSEGQFDTVLDEELPLMMKAFERVSPKAPYRPTLSIIICSKRHHAQFNGTSTEHVDSTGNTKAGTVIDQGVTDVFRFDFYLQAHAVPQFKGKESTVKGTRYIGVYDENALRANVIQQGTHTASYLYARATKAVSLIPAAYYADLACERGRCYLNDLLNLGDEQTSTAGKTTGSGRRDREEERMRAFERAKNMWGEGIHAQLRESMFYI